MNSKNIIRILVVTGLLLLVPLIGRWPWTLFDFAFAALLFGGAGLAYEFVASRSPNVTYRVAVAITAIACLLLIWVNGAVGIIGDEGGPNLLYSAVILVGFFGAILSQAKPAAMARTAFLMAIVQALVPLVVLSFRSHEFNQPPGMADVFVLNSFFVMLFVGSGLLFRQAANPK